MRVHFKLTRQLWLQALQDLRRPHEFASERCAFLACKPSSTRQGLLILAHQYLEVKDEWYVDDPSFGCVFGPDAMRHALQFSFSKAASIFHIHLHEHRGIPWFSRADLRESQKFVPDFWNVQPLLPHGTMVLSDDHAAGLCWYPGADKPYRIPQITAVGMPMKSLTKC